MRAVGSQLHEGGVVVDELRADVTDQHGIDGEPLQKVHRWMFVFQFPSGIFWPYCSCGWLEPDGLRLPNRDAAYELSCPVADREAWTSVSHG